MAFLQIEDNINTEEIVEDIVVGIDLGTTNSLVAIIENDNVKIIQDDNNLDIHPSIVSFDNDGNFISIGKKIDNAINISSIKRLMGKDFDDIKDKRFPFQITHSKQDKSIKIKVGNQEITPIEISSKILKYLKSIAEKYLKKEVKKAVITVPAYFDDAAKNATKLSANLAGLEVVRLINEPTAAAFAYGLNNQSEGIYCVYDIGGGTFDVSVLKMQQGIFRVIGVAGDNNLGGDDFDFELEKLGCKEAKLTKEKLSYQENYNGINKDQFEKAINDKVEKTMSLTTNLIEDLEIEIDDIKGLILVGGSSRIPLIKKKLTEIFGKEKILTNLDPDRIVAIGSAWQAHNLSSSNKNLLLDVSALSLGVEMMGGIVEKIITRNSTVPITKTKEFTTYVDGQTGMKFHIVQGERELAKDCRSLAKFEIKNIPPMPAGMIKVLVTFQLDVDGLLTVSAEELKTKTKQQIEILPSYFLTEKEIKKMLLESLENSKEDLNQRLLIESINQAKQDIEIINARILDYKNNDFEEDFLDIKEKISNLEIKIKNNSSRQEIEESHQDLKQALNNFLESKNQTS